MRRVLSILCLIGFAFLAGCDSLTKVDIDFAIYNASSSRIQAIVLANKIGSPIEPQSTGTARVGIPVPSSNGGVITNAYSEIVAPSVTFYDITLNKLSEPVTCSMNARGVVSVTYKMYYTNYDSYAYISCGTSSFAKVPLHTPSLEP